MRLTLPGMLAAAGVTLAACDAASLTAFEPLTNAVAVQVSLETSPLAQPTLPRLSAETIGGTVEVVWTMAGAPCTVATAIGAQAGFVIEIQIQRSGDPLANCAPDRVHFYRQAARVEALPAGRYELRIVDAPLGQTPRELGRRVVIVPVIRQHAPGEQQVRVTTNSTERRRPPFHS